MGGADVAAMVKGWDCCVSVESWTPHHSHYCLVQVRNHSEIKAGTSTYKDVQAGHAQIDMLPGLPLALSPYIHFDRRCTVRHLFDRRYTLPLGNA